MRRPDNENETVRQRTGIAAR